MTDDDEKLAKLMRETGMTEDRLRELNELQRGDARYLDAADVRGRLRALTQIEARLQFEHAVAVRSMLDDGAPYLDGQSICELRLRALEVLEVLSRRGKTPLDIGDVRVCRPMPRADVERLATDQLARLSKLERQNVLAQADAYLGASVVPSPQEKETLRNYVVLQQLDCVPYVSQRVDSSTLLMPLQREMLLERTHLPRPTPRLRVSAVEDPEVPVAYLYKISGDRYWSLERLRHPAAGEVSESVARVQSIEKTGVPRVVLDERGQPRRNLDGTLVLDGIVEDSEMSTAYLHTVAAFLPLRFLSMLE